MANRDFEWSGEEIKAAGLDKKRINSVVQRLKSIVKDLVDMDLAIYVASDSANIHQKGRHPQANPHTPDHGCVIAYVPGPFDGGDW